MITTIVQRWRRRREAYRPAAEPINTSLYEVAMILDDTTAKSFVIGHHYSGTYPAARWRFGLYDRAGQLVGVAVFSHPCNDRVLTNVFPVAARDATELGRFVLLDAVPGNGETWFLARCFELLRNDVAGVLSFADPVPRIASDGRVVHVGHVGTIYQAFNGTYLGRGRAQVMTVLPDGSVFSHRARQKVRGRERGWRYCARMLETFGAAPLSEHEDARSWIDAWLPRLSRPVRHPGNHKYAWCLDRTLRRTIGGTALPYPKQPITPTQLSHVI